MSEKVQVLMIADRTPLALVLLGKDLLALPRIVQVGEYVGFRILRQGGWLGESRGFHGMM